MALDYFTARERRLLAERFDTLYAAPGPSAAKGITCNTLRPGAEKALASLDIPLRPSPFCAQSRLLPPDAPALGRHPYHHAGVFYIQEPSAASVVPLLDVRPGMRVLDLCAAPGGKASQLAAALQGSGLLIANEYAVRRTQALKSNLERMGVPNAVILNETADRIAGMLSGYFDRVLLDAPCSGEGMFRKEPQAAAQHGPALVAQCAALGRSLLDAAAVCLAPEGILCYSTCTFSPEEDEGQIAAFLARHPEFELLPSDAQFGAPGEANRTGGLPLDTDRVRRIWPCHGGEGHFMAKLQKHGGSPANRTDRLPRRAGPLAQWEEFRARAFPQLQGKKAVLWGDTVFLAPEEMPDLGKLHILRGGVMAGRLQKGRFEPAHQLYMVYGAQAAEREELGLNDPRVSAWLKGEEIPAATVRNSGWCAVLADGFPLGFGKASGGRIKNHYPKALRNLR